MRADDKKVSILLIIFWVCVLLFFCCSCKSKKSVSKQTSDISSQTNTKEEAITATRSDELTEIKQYQVAQTIIYPSEAIKVNADGSVEGKIDSIKITHSKQTDFRQVKRDTTFQEVVKEAESSLKSETLDYQKDVERSTNVLGLIGGVVLFVFFIWIVYKVKSFIP